MFIIPTNPSEELLSEEFLKDFMFKNNFAIDTNARKWELMLFDNIDHKIYTYPMANRGDKQWVLKMMCLIISLRNFKESWLKEKDFHKRRKIFSKMNCIKGKLNECKM